ncbi:MAG: hypothetical protein FD144_3105 [Rhodospirillaceae bacterium]|nr:MAG: hypothetical protein FD144_3105 [Rhodospirillaceae bacterium]
MPLLWMRSDEFGILTVVGQGDIGRQDIEDYLGATVREGTKAHAKLVDLTVGNLILDRDDLESVARTMVEYGVGGEAGPVAMVVLGALNIDMAVLLKQRVGSRPFRVFTDPLEARGWLMTFPAAPAEPGVERPMAQRARPVR